MLCVPHSCVPVQNFFRFPLCSCVPVSRSFAPVSTSVHTYAWGVGCNTCTVCLWTDQTGRVNSPPGHYPPSSCVRSVQYKYTGGKPVWVRSNLCLVYNPPFHFSSQYTHTVTVSSRTQKRKFSIPILSLSAFPCSCLKFAFPLAAFLKTLEHRNVGMGNQDCVPISGGWHAS